MKKFILYLFLIFTSISGFSQQGFEGTTGTTSLPLNPTTWSLTAGATLNGDWAIFDNGTGTGVRWDINAASYQGSNAAYCNREEIGAGNTSEDFLATPAITVPANGQLKFWTRQFVAIDFGTLYEIRVKPAILNTVAEQTNPTGYVTLQQWTETTLNATYNQYEEKIVNLTPTYAAGASVYIAFVMKFTQPGATISGDRWLIDEVKLVQLCLPPTALNATAISHNAATLNWTLASGTASYQVVNSLAGTYNSSSINASPIITGTSTTGSFAMTAGSLTPNTNYEFWVRSDCGSGNFSTWVGPIAYRTVSLGFNCAAAITIPPTLPYSTTDNTSNYGDVYDVIQNNACGGGATNYMAGNDVWYSFTPNFTGNVSISLTPTANNSSIFVYSSCPTANQTCLAGVANTNSSIRSIPFFAVTSGTTYIIAISSSVSTQTVPYTLVIQKVNCQMPTGLSVGTIGAYTANLSWIETGTATSWEVAVLPAGPPTPPTTAGIQTNINTNFAHPATLLPSTNYQYWVRSDCNDGTFSAWAGPFAFTTLPSCTAPTLPTISLITQSTALASWTQNANYNGTFPTQWQVNIVPANSPAPVAASPGWINVTTSNYFFIGLTPSTCYDYYVRAYCSSTDQSAISVKKSFCTLIPNDDCQGSIPVPVNQNTNCLQVVTGSLENATASIQPNTCGATADDDDAWFNFTATATSHYISLFGINYTATPTGLSYAIYTGTCPTLTQIGGCQANNTQSNPILTGLTPGTTYYIRVYSTGTTPVSTTFEVCVGTNVGNCGTAIPLCAVQPIIIPNNVGVATLPNPISPFSTTSTTVGCLGSAPSPTFYYLQIPQDGNYNFFLEQNTNNTFTGTGIDVDFVAWGPYATNAAACAGISTSNAPPTGNACSFSGAFTENYTINGAVAGQIYVIMITNFNGRKGFVRITQTQGPLPTNCCPFGNFTYPNTMYCKDSTTNPLPTFVSTAVAGTFTATPAGLVINPTTGQITLGGASTAGTYLIRNTIGANGACPADVDSWTITITDPPTNTAISYSSTSYCLSDGTTYAVNQTGTTGGNYTVFPATGLGINLTTGAITPSASTAAGTYTVTYNIPPKGGCVGASSNTTVTIINTPSSGVVTGTQSICHSGTTQFATNVTPGGTWSSSDTNIATVSTTGLVTSVGAGTATISYLAPGSGVVGCPNPVAATRTVTVYQPVVSGAIVGTSLLCLPLPQSTQLTNPTGTTGGVWSITPTTVATISANGLVSAVGVGSATVRYTITNPVGSPCANPPAATFILNVAASVTAGILTGTQNVCVGSTTTFSSTVLGGTWDVSVNPAVASVNATTGVVTGSVAGIATIRYTYTASGGGCTGTATATRTVTVAAAPNAGTISGNQTICMPGGSTQFITTGSGGSWSATPGGIVTVNSAGLVTGVNTGTATVNYFVVGTGGCANAISTRTVNVYARPAVPTGTSPAAVCVQTPIQTLTATATAPAGSTVVWYNAMTGGTVVPSPTLSSVGTVTYYAESVSTVGGCTSASRKAITLTINPAPAAPSGTSPAAVCAQSPIQTLTATATAPAGSTVVWYNAMTGGTVVTSPTLSTVGTVTYYAESVVTAGGCKSLTRTAITLTINDTPATPSGTSPAAVCEQSPIQTLTATVTAPVGTSIVWYTAATAGSVVASPTWSTVGNITYYAESVGANGCKSLTRRPITLTISPAPAAPSGTSPAAVCEQSPIQTLTATATAPVGSTVVWYSAITGGIVVASPTLNTVGSITYYAESVGANGCKSLTRTAITLTINPAPSAPSGTSPAAVCEQSPIQTLTATATPPTGSTIVWYNAMTGGTVVASPTLNTVGSITYYGQSVDANGCISLTRTAITLTISPAPAAPTGVLTQNFCNSATVANLSAVGTTVQWYANPSGGTPLLSSVALLNGTRYYASQTNVNGCESLVRLNVLVNISTPVAPTGAATQLFCAAPAPTVANLVALGTGIKWYANATGGTPLTASTLLVSGTKYYASQTITTPITCESIARFEVTVTVVPQLVLTLTGACQGNPFVLNVARTSGVFATGTTFAWTGPNGFASALQSPSAPLVGTYTVTVTDPFGCKTTESTVVTTIACVIQKGISPNGDGLNDFFDLTAYNVKRFSIYNRYGRAEYVLDNYTNQWNGQSDNGGELPDGVYYYQIERNDGSSLTGWIYINRENK